MTTSIFEGLTQFATKIFNAVAEDLGEDPEEIGELILVEHTRAGDLLAFPIYIVDLPDQDLEVYLWDYHNDGKIEVYATIVLSTGACYSEIGCVSCTELAAQVLTPKA